MRLPNQWVSVDPGETTGYAVWNGNQLSHASALPLWDVVRSLGFNLLSKDLKSQAFPDSSLLIEWDLLVMEDWQLYPQEAANLAWDKQDTVRGIGALDFIARALGRPCEFQPATIKDAAKSVGAETLFRRPLHPNRHANDAIMHGVYYAAQAGEGVAEVT